MNNTVRNSLHVLSVLVFIASGVLSGYRLGSQLEFRGDNGQLMGAALGWLGGLVAAVVATIFVARFIGRPKTR